MQKNKNKFAFNGTHLRNIKNRFEEQTGVRLGDASIKRFQPRLVIAATLIAALFLMSAGGVFITVNRILKGDGSFSLQYIFRKQYSPPQGEKRERFLWENEFFGGDSEEILGLIIHGGTSMTTLGEVDWNGAGVNYPAKNIHDYDEFIEFMEQTDKTLFKLPEYIPEGYEFSNAAITFYIDKDFDYENAEPTEREEKYGNVYEKYYIPENPANVRNIDIFYTKDETINQYNSNGNSIWYAIYLQPGLLKNSSISFPSETRIDILKTPQFQRSSIAETDYTENGKSWTAYSFNAASDISAKQILKAHMFSERYRKFWETYSKPDGGDHTEELRSAHYLVQSHCAARDEVIKIAESIK